MGFPKLIDERVRADVLFVVLMLKCWRLYVCMYISRRERRGDCVMG